MVPNNALSLSSDGIALLRRDGDVWQRLGEMSFHTDDLDAALGALRDIAMDSGPDGRQVLLILPDDQIRYLDLPDPGDESARGADVRAALDGATPYDVSELVYDWQPVPGRLQVAAVARETLAEAESFVAAQGFDPVSFAAAPATGSFAGAPFFGAASGWAGPAPHRIAGPIRIVATPPPVGKPPATAPDVARPAPDARRRTTAPMREAASEPASPQQADAAGRRTNLPPSGATPATEAETGPLPVMQPEAMAEAAPRPAPLPAPAPVPAPGPPPAFLTAPTPPSTPGPASDPSTESPVAAPADFGTGMFGPGMFGPGGDARTAALAPLPEPPAARIRPAADKSGAAPDTPSFTSIRASRDLPDSSGQMVLTSGAPKPSAPPVAAPAVTESAAAPRRQDRPALRAALAPVSNQAPAVAAAAPDRNALASDTAARNAPARTPPRPAKPAARPAAKPAQGAAPHTAAARQPAPASAEAPAPKPARPRQRKSAPPVPASPRPTSPGPVAPRSAPGEAPPVMQAAMSGTAMSGAADPEDERRRMTVFGARREEDIGGKPRFLGLMLTMVLLLFLLAVAAWASVFLDEGLSRFFGPADEEATEVAAADPAMPAPIQVEPQVAPEVLALLPPAPGSDITADAAPAATAPARIAPSPEEAAARYAATGIWQRSPSPPPDASPDSIDDFYVASVDPRVEQFDAVALPPEPLSEGAAQPVALPPGPDVRFDLDARGLVRATPEGAVSPDGVRVFTGPPPQVPPARAQSTVAEDAAGAAAEDPDAPAVAPTDPALGARRPSARPGDLVEQSERVVLSGFSVAELEQKRPVIRPDSVRAAVAEAVAQAVAAAPPAPPPGPEAPAEEAGAPDAEVAVSTALAVARSLEPQLRPPGMARRAENTPVQTAPAAAVRAQPAPRIPQNASVARQATMSNQLNLRETSLIGVFGSASNRRALVRLSNGRLQNVKVGDRLDGGRVAAIGDSELQLTKRGRNLVLRMPRG
ncbi:hypothetical protein [Salipiger aestuarii]|nr:hypothetical protein [Salipiger aestuarii]